MNTSETFYTLSLAELIDRLSICQLREINSKVPDLALRDEIVNIKKEIDKNLSEKPLTSDSIRAVLVLAFVNKFIWDNETEVRANFSKTLTQEEKNDLLEKLIKTHDLNGLRAVAKKKIQLQTKGRVDQKLNYGSEDNFSWKVTW